MEIILITILLTLLGAGLVALLVWLSVVSWKSIKLKKESELTFIDLHKRIDEESDSRGASTNMLLEELDRSKEDVNKNFEEVYNKISHEFDELHRETINNIWRKFDEVEEGIEHRFESLERSIDSRFDKMYNSLKDIEKQIEKK